MYAANQKCCSVFSPVWFYPLNYLTKFLQIFSQCFCILFGPVTPEVGSCGGSWKQEREDPNHANHVKACMLYVLAHLRPTAGHEPSPICEARKCDLPQDGEKERMIIYWTIIELVTLGIIVPVLQII